MSENKKLELLDQYDDVTFALLMDEYAEEEGARLRKEFEEAQAAGEVSDTSDALDEKCLQMIHRDFAKKRGKDNVRKIIRMTSKVAVAVMVFLGIAATTIMSVDALRIPVLSYLVEHFSEYGQLDFSTQPTAKPFDSISDPVSDLLPEGYHEVYYEVTDGLISSMYENDNSQYVVFDMSLAIGEYCFDTENAIIEEIILDEYEALLIKKDRLQAIWLDEESQVVYTFTASEMEEEEFLNICESLAKYYNKHERVG